jgi:hypothetical protein
MESRALVASAVISVVDTATQVVVHQGPPLPLNATGSVKLVSSLYDTRSPTSLVTFRFLYYYYYYYYYY